MNELLFPSNIPMNIDAMAETMILCLLLLASLAVAFSRNLLFSLISMGCFSLLMATIYLFMNSPDVAMTEAAIGACLTTVFCLIALSNLYDPGNDNFITKSGFSWGAFLFSALVAAILVFVALNLPEYGRATNPINEHVVPYYLQNTGKDIGINSVVASILASYRGYDTLGETVVIMTAGLCCLMLLDRGVKPEYNDDEIEKSDLLLKVVAKFTIPFITIYAFYIQIHGEVSPGGGFQAGAILASGFILFALVLGTKNFVSLYSTNLLKLLSVLGVLIYAGTGLVSLYGGKDYLNYYFLDKYSSNGQELGIVLVEIGVGITVASVLLLIFQVLALRKENVV